MPWLSEATKDVTSCDKPRLEANTHQAADFRMGQPGAGDRVTGMMPEQTRGTETSHYPEEKKAKAIAQVAASERARAQTADVATHPRGCRTAGNVPAEVSRRRWKAPPQRVIAP